MLRLVDDDLDGARSDLESVAVTASRLGVLNTAAFGFAYLARSGCSPGGTPLTSRVFWSWQDLYADALVAGGRGAEADEFLVPHENLAAIRGSRTAIASAGGSQTCSATGPV